MGLKEAYDLLLFTGKLTTAIQLLPCIIFLYKYRIIVQKPWIWLFFYCLFNFLLNLFSIWFISFTTKHYDTIGSYLDKLNIHNTFFIEPVFYLNLIIFLGLFSLAIINNQKVKKILGLVIVVSSLFIIWNTFWGEGYAEYQVVGSIVKNCVKFSYLFLLLVYLYKSKLNNLIRKNPIFWVVLSLSVSIILGGFLELISNRMFNDTEVMFYIMHIILNGFLIIASLLLLYGIVLVPPKESKSTIYI